MFVARSANSQASLWLATMLAAVTLPTLGQAYTAEEQQACSGDAFRLCSAEIPDVDRVTVCMIRNKAQLSPGCRAFFRPGPEASETTGVPAGRPMSIKPVSAHKGVGAKSKKHKKPVKSGAT
jgi:hypothetical protein